MWSNTTNLLLSHEVVPPHLLEFNNFRGEGTTRQLHGLAVGVSSRVTAVKGPTAKQQKTQTKINTVSDKAGERRIKRQPMANNDDEDRHNHEFYEHRGTEVEVGW